MMEIVGILNITPDSFSDGGRYNDTNRALYKAEQMFSEGADMVDIGAESTRPGADEVVMEEEWRRLEPVLDRLRQYFPARSFSIDTRHAEIVRRAAACWSPELTINDVSGLTDKRMVEVVAVNGLRVIVNHLPVRAAGSIAAAHSGPKMSSPWEVRDQLVTTYLKAVAQGVKPENIILDPGIGFGKTRELNRELVGFAALMPSFSIMTGYSRKRFLGLHRMEAAANTAAGYRAVLAGTDFLRVHDVAAHRDMLERAKDEGAAML